MPDKDKTAVLVPGLVATPLENEVSRLRQDVAYREAGRLRQAITQREEFIKEREENLKYQYEMLVRDREDLASVEALLSVASATAGAKEE